MNPPFELLLIYAWRRHLAAAVGRIEAMGAKDEDLHTIDVTVGFADLVSFTALSNTLDREEIGDLVEVFESRCQDVVAALRRTHHQEPRRLGALRDSGRRGRRWPSRRGSST